LFIFSPFLPLFLKFVLRLIFKIFLYVLKELVKKIDVTENM